MTMTKEEINKENPKRKQERRVSFDDKNLKQILSIDGPSLEENLWYNRQDFDNFKSQTAKNDEQTDKEVSSEKILKRQTRHFLVAAILAQQKEHRELGMCDPKGLLQISKLYSRKSRSAALKDGKNVAAEVKQQLEQEENDDEQASNLSAGSKTALLDILDQSLNIVMDGET